MDSGLTVYVACHARSRRCVSDMGRPGTRTTVSTRTSLPIRCAATGIAGVRCARTAMRPRRCERYVGLERTSSRSASGLSTSCAPTGIGVPRRNRPVHQARQPNHAQLLASFPDRREGGWLSPKRMAGWLRSVGYNGGIGADVLYNRLVAAAPGLTGSEGDARGQITVCLVTAVETLNAQIAVVEDLIADLFATHPDQHIFSSLPRSGTVRAASLLSEIGDCRERFPTDSALAGLAGACPSTRQSGKYERAVFRWSCNKKLRAAVMDFANGSRMADPWAADIYQRAIDRGCRHPHAIRILARAWLRIIWRCWQDGVAFDPDLHRARFTVAA